MTRKLDSRIHVPFIQTFKKKENKIYGVRSQNEAFCGKSNDWGHMSGI